MNDFTRINLLGQYRFLRAIEMGFGIFSVLFVKTIFSDQKFNRMFLLYMSLGSLGRIASLIADGFPSGQMYFYLVFELVGIGVISFYSYRIFHPKSNSSPLKSD